MAVPGDGTGPGGGPGAGDRPDSGAAAAAGTGVLAGIRVIELATYIAGPGACGLLADWGAEVIKVESAAGDPFRRFFDGTGQDVTENRVFETDNRGKQSIVLDIADADDAATLRALIASADVFVTNFRPGSLARAGIDWDALHIAHPRLVMASFTGFGATGPEADKPGFDITAFWARSGLCSIMSTKDAAPINLRTGIGDHMASTALVAGIAAALFHRERTGQGQRIESSLLRMGVYAAASEHAVQLQFGRIARTKSRGEAVNVLNNYFRTRDGQWIIGVPRQGPDELPRFARAIGRPNLIDDPRFQGFRARRANGQALVDTLDAGFAAMTFDEAAAALDREGVIWAPVLTLAQAAADPQAHAAGCFVAVPQDEGEALVVPNGPVDFGAFPDRTRRRAPRLDEHGDAIRDALRRG